MTRHLPVEQDGSQDLGFVAEEMNELDPILATLGEDGEPDGVRYPQLTALLTKAIQKQQAQIEKLHARLARLESE